MTEPAKTVAKKRRQIGKYRLIASLGQGGMAKVYLALMAGPAGFNKLLVIKALRDDMSDPGGEFVGMFLEEARLAAQLNHPNVVQTYEVGEADGRYYIAMEYLEGQSLRTVQRRLGRDNLPLAESLRILAETARGLHYAHELCGFDGEPLHCVHRDVSPQNVFLTYDGQVKLLDFGIARTGDPERETQVGVIKGKADYIAPEQVKGDRVDRRADVFSLGAMLWETLAGRRFSGGPKISDVTKIHNRVTGAEPMLQEVAPGVPEALQALCEQALALDPDDRFPTAEHFAEALDAYLDSTGDKPSRSSLGSLLAPAFQAERDKLSELIDAQVQLVQSQAVSTFPGNTGTLPSLGPPPSQSSGSLGTDASSGSVSVGRGTGGSRNAEAAAPSRTGTTAHSTLLDLSAVSPEEARDSGAPGNPPATPNVTTATPPRRWAAWVVGVLAVAVGAYLGARGRDHAELDTNAAEPAPARQTPHASDRPAASENETVRLRIEADPPDARASLDGHDLPGLPFEARVDKDGKLHKLVVGAHGFRTLRQMLTFEHDQNLHLELVPRRHSGEEDDSTEDGAQDDTQDGADAPTEGAVADGPANAAAQQDEGASSRSGDRPARKRPPARRQVVAPGENLVGSTPTRAPPAPRIDVEDPYR